MDREQWARHLLDCLNGWLDNRHSDNQEVRSEYQEDLISALTTTPSTPAPATEACQHAGTCCGEAVKLLRAVVGAFDAGWGDKQGVWMDTFRSRMDDARAFLSRLDSKGPTS